MDRRHAHASLSATGTALTLTLTLILTAASLACAEEAGRSDADEAGEAGTTGQVSESLTDGAPTDADTDPTDTNTGPAPTDAGTTDTSEDEESEGRIEDLPPLPPPLDPLADFSIAWYPSAQNLLLASLEANAAAYDTSQSYSHSAAQGYTLQATAALLRASVGWSLPGGLERKLALVDLSLGEIDELEAAAGEVVGGGPAFGLADAWDAFGDGSVNPAYTAYTWQSGMVALGVGELLLVVSEDPELQGALSGAQLGRLADAQLWLGEVVDYWAPHYTEVPGEGGYFWYSDQPADAIAVHNTSALIAMAWWHYGMLVGDLAYADQAERCADLLKARISTTAAGGWAWRYADDGYPKPPVWEDVSHALITNQFIRFAGARDWWSPADMGRQGITLLEQMWSGHPSRLHGRVDGSSGGESEWTWTRAAVVGYAAHGDAEGGQPASFDYARSILLSSYLSPYGIDPEQGTISVAQALAIARLFEHRPQSYAPDSGWLTVAGPGDDALPRRPGGTRFYTIDWSAPGPVAFAGLEQPARTATAVNANLLVDLEPGDARPVVVSLTYAVGAGGSVGQWDGQAYQPLASLPATQDNEGQTRWMRTSFLLGESRFDYQGAVPGDNVLLQISSLASVSRIEATVLE